MRPSIAFPEPVGRFWRQEVRASLLLAYPLILTNLTQAGIQAADVIMLGWAGPRQLVAGALAANLFTVFLVFGVGLMTAASPMIAQELGARFNSIRDVRRTVRQAMWSAVVLVVPAWIALWYAEAILNTLGQDPELSSAAARYLRALKWGLLPALWFYVLRAFVSALKRPIWSLLISGGGILVNGVLAYALIFGRFGLPQLGLTGAGIASAVTNVLMFAAITLVVGFMEAMALALIVLPYPLIYAFMDEADPANAPVIPLAVTFLGVAALFQIVDGA